MKKKIIPLERNSDFRRTTHTVSPRAHFLLERGFGRKEERRHDGVYAKKAAMFIFQRS